MPYRFYRLFTGLSMAVLLKDAVKSSDKFRKIDAKISVSL